MSNPSPTEQACVLCGEAPATFPEKKPALCDRCYARSETLFDEEMRRIELIRTIRGQDVELYDIKHPSASSEQKHCGQVILIRAGKGFEVKICLRSNALDWMEHLHDEESTFTSQETRLDALIGNVSLLIESWGGGPHYMDILDVTSVVSIEGEI